MVFMPAFDAYPKEAMIIGKIVVGYGELEFDWMLCLSELLGDMNNAIRTLYRVKSEGSRFDIGDALLRPHYEKLGLSGEYQRAYDAMFWCKNLRNAYAHSHWIGPPETLARAEIESIASSKNGTKKFPILAANLADLEKQEKYFEYCQSLLIWLQHEAQKKSGKASNNPFPRPKTLRPPQS